MTQWTRRGFLQGTVGAGVAALAPGCATIPGGSVARRPNVLVIITDDQGYGDLGCHGNPYLRTPHLDGLHDESVRLTNFCVSPVCSPTRSSLMTGRYNYRTGVVDTYMGRSMMYGDELTLAELLRGAGYRTGIFGKWHLGDNYPMRAMDQGFEECLVHRGGGIGQPSDPPGNTYFDPVLQHNGVSRRYEGYCTDIFADAAIAFMRTHREGPFFTYLSTNTPHVPLQVEERYVKPYLDMGLDETTARIYAMIENIDENVGRVLAALREEGLEEDTLVWFLTDNGGQITDEAPRYNAGLRAAKGSLYEGGIRVPSFVRYPAGWEGNREVALPGAHIDMLPTLLECCGVALPSDRIIDGRSLLPLLRGEEIRWPDRNLYFQWHRGDVPEPHRDAVVRGPRYKLVRGSELYDLVEDPGETRDISAAHPEIVARMRAEYEAWFAEMAAERDFLPPRIALGGPENPVLLTAQDWRGPVSWHASLSAYWEVEVLEPGVYDIVLDFVDEPASGKAVVSVAAGTAEGIQVDREFPEPTTEWRLENVALQPAAGHLEFLVSLDNEAKGVRYVKVISKVKLRDDGSAPVGPRAAI